jgi:flagellin
MRINTNISSLNAQRSLTRSAEDMSASLQRLSSGLRINSARDDAAGLAISERMRAGINGLRRASQNINDGISLLQVADGAAAQLHSNFQRMRELAVQAANGSNSQTDRAAIQQEADALARSNIDIVGGARFNNEKLLDGGFSRQLQVGDRAGQVMLLTIPQALVQESYNTAMVNIAPQQSTAIGKPVLAALKYGDLQINNGIVGASVAGPGLGQGASSAFAAAAAINASNIRNVTATATTMLEGLTGSVGTLPAGSFSINGVDVGTITGLTAADFADSAAAAISATAAASGVTASAAGGKLTLTAADGRDIVLAQPAPGTVETLGLVVGTNKGAVTVNEAPRPGTHVMVIGGRNPGAAGLIAGKQKSEVAGPPDFQEQTVHTPGEPPLDLSTFSGATEALDYLDAKIEEISNVRSMLGATSNRLTAAASNADNTANNLSAARSRILDTDYAAETAQLTRTRILQQAGMSIIAQANAAPQQALLVLLR